MRLQASMAWILISVSLAGCVAEGEGSPRPNTSSPAGVYDTASDDEGPRGPVSGITPISNTGGRGIPKYVGTTSVTLGGNSGYSAFNTACESDFPNTRVCTDMELFSTIPAPVPGVDVWMLMTPHLTDMGSWYNPLGQGGGPPNCLDGQQRLFRGSSGTTLYMDSIGEVQRGLCSDQRAVACCGY